LNTDSESISTAPRKRQWWFVPAIIGTVILSTVIWFKMSYPYGPLHCCTKILGQLLTEFAAQHDGWFPAGQNSPEASLSLLCSNSVTLVPTVRGKTVAEPVARAALLQDGVLSPESCGWNYVEGLSTNDSSQLAIAWDKSWGVGHDGRRIRGFGREVVYTDGSDGVILFENWPKFAMEQRDKLTKLIAARETNGPPIRWSDEESLGTNWFPRPK